MPCEPIEAKFIYLPALSPDQEEKYCQLDQKGPPLSSLSCHSTHGATTYVGTGGNIINLKSLKKKQKIEGYHVSFEKGQHENPREWGKGHKWFVSLSHVFFKTSN